MEKMIITFSGVANQKFNEMISYSKEKVKAFMDTIDKSLKEKKYGLYLRIDRGDLYYIKFNKIYVIFIKKGENVVVFDLLVEEEFNLKKGRAIK